MPWLTVAQNLQLVKPNLTELDIKNILDSIGLSKSQHHYPKQLSGGMQRRVALARAFCIQPDILLLDEPFISLDAPTANECRNTLQRLQQAYGTQFILVTHDLHEAIELADKVIFLSKRPAKEILTLNVIDERRLSNTTQNMVDELLLRHPNLLSGELSK
jgi:NitT/TauT family transport system ATP-binding protein